MKIIEAGVQAPSGENSQPWRFKISGNEINLENASEADQSLYNFRQRGSLVSHGAAIENMTIAARFLGYEQKITIFPEPTNHKLVAKISLTKSSEKNEPLYPYIKKRATNRKVYTKEKLSEATKKALLKTNFDISGARVLIAEEQEEVEALAEAASANEKVMLQNEPIHDFFFSHVRWTKIEDDKYKNGFYLKTLELAPPQVAVFRILRNWRMQKFLNHVGILKFIAKENAKVYAQAGAFVAITTDTFDDVAFVDAGRITLRLWLELCRAGWSVQPLTGALFLKQSADADPRKFSNKERKTLDDAVQNIRRTFGVTRDNVIMMFRVGKSDPPTARSSRFSLDSFLI